MKEETDISTLQDLDVRVGTVKRAEENNGSRDPAFKVWVDFGEGIGTLKTSAKLTELYEPDELVGKQVVGIINFPDKQVADMMSEFLLLGALGDDGVPVLTVDRDVKNGTKIA